MEKEQQKRLETAQWMAQKGINAFVVNPGSKRPLEGRSWYLRQTDDPETLERWFREIPDCNYGVHPGGQYVVIDLDRKPHINGVQAFEEICRENGIEDFKLEIDTLMVKTPGGGWHIYFKAPYPCSNKNDFPDGIDVRGVHGYVVGPGSEDSRGVWEVVDPDAPIADLPEWLEEYIYEPGYKDPNRDTPVCDWDLPENVEHAKEWLKSRDPAIEGQNGDDWTYETIQYVRDFGVSEDRAIDVLSEWNQRCEPPWTVEELEVKIDNAYLFGQNRPGSKSPSYRAQRVLVGHGEGMWAHLLTPEQIAEVFHPSDKLKLVVDNTAEDDDIPQVEDAGDEFLVDLAVEPSETPLLKDVLEWAFEPVFREYLVWNTFPAFGLNWFKAKRGTGKTSVAVDLGLSVACDLDWCDRPTLKGWKVVFLALEDADGVRMATRGWMQDRDTRPAPGHFMAVDVPLKVMAVADLKKLATAIDQWREGAPVLIVVDTWQRATSGTSRSDQELMDVAVEHCEAMCRELDATVLINAHPPKSGSTVYGSGVQEDTSASISELSKANEGVKLTVSRIKGPGEGGYACFKRKQVELVDLVNGHPVTLTDAHGKPRTAPVMEHIGGTVDPERVPGGAGRGPEHAEAVVYALDRVTADQPGQDFSLSALARQIKGMSFRDDETGKNDTLPDTSTSIKRALQRTLEWHGLKITFENGDTLEATKKETEAKGKNGKPRIKTEWTIRRVSPMG